MSRFDLALLCHGTTPTRYSMAVINSDKDCSSPHKAPISQHKPNGHDPCETTEGDQRAYACRPFRNGKLRSYGAQRTHAGGFISTQQERLIWLFYSGVHFSTYNI
jgi:hypothetical protein